MTNLEPVAYDGHGAPLYAHQIGEPREASAGYEWQIADRLSPEDRQKLLDSVDKNEV